ncbi:MAG: hypothetical protein II918_02765 [Firmicutes bacterium]|nr:hypothetical protein [Bacillota bacterium]
MGKHLSLLMMNTGRKFDRLVIIMAAMAVFELICYFAIGSKAADAVGTPLNSFSIVISTSGIWTGYIGGLLLTALLVSREPSKKSNAQTELTMMRLEISERTAYFWSIIGNALRCLLITAYQTVLIFMIWKIYQGSGVSNTTELQQYMEFNGIRILSWFFPTSSLMGWLDVLIIALSFGLLGTAINIKRMKVSKIILFIWIGYLMIHLMTQIGFSFDDSMMLLRVTLLGTDLGFMFYLLVIAHDGKNANNTELRGETI